MLAEPQRMTPAVGPAAPAQAALPATLLRLIEALTDMGAAFLTTPPGVAPPVRLLLTRDQVAAVIGMETRTFARMVSGGEFPPADVRRSRKFVRWKWSTVVAWVEQQCEATAAELASR